MDNITTQKGYVRGKETAAPEAFHHVMPMKTYLGVFGALMILTAITVLVSEADLGSAALPVAMVVAIIKAAFVVGFFMHLKYDTRFHSFVFFGTLFFVALFFLFPFLDSNTRDAVNPLWGNDRMVEDKGINVAPEPIADPNAAPHEPAAEIKVEEKGE